MLYRVRILFIIVMSQTLLGYARASKSYSQLYNKYGGPKFMYGHHGMVKLKMHKYAQLTENMHPLLHQGPDEIIPGQVIHEHRGPDIGMLPGQVIHENRGSDIEMLPGQVIHEHRGSDIEMLPGQVIHEEILPGQVVHEVLPPQYAGNIEEIMPYRYIRIKSTDTLIGSQSVPRGHKLTDTLTGSQSVPRGHKLTDTLTGSQSVPRGHKLTDTLIGSHGVPRGHKGPTSNGPNSGKASPTLLTTGKHTFPFEIHNKVGRFGDIVDTNTKPSTGKTGGGEVQGFWPVVEVPGGDLGQNIQVLNIGPQSHGTGQGNNAANIVPNARIGGAQYVPAVTGSGSDIGVVRPDVHVIEIVPGSVFGGSENGGNGVGSVGVTNGIGISGLGAGKLTGNVHNGNSGGKSVLGSANTVVMDKSGSILKDSTSKTIETNSALLQPGGISISISSNVVGIPISTSRKLFKERQLAKTHNPFLRLMTLQAFGPGPYRLCKPPAVVVCDARPGWEHVDGMTSWCRRNCVVFNYSSYCDDNRCFCQCTSG